VFRLLSWKLFRQPLPRKCTFFRGFFPASNKGYKINTKENRPISGKEGGTGILVRLSELLFFLFIKEAYKVELSVLMKEVLI